MADDAQARGYAWDRELARRMGGRPTRGSGNRVYSRLDAGSGLIIGSGKHTDADSFRVTAAMVDEATRAVMGPEAMQGGYQSFLAVHMGLDLSGPALALVDLDTLLEWIREPPGLLQATRQDQIRATARVPPFLRE